MKSEWRDCIVTFIDLSGVKRLAPSDGAGSKLMRQLHRLAAKEIPRLSTVAHAYVWNDSILLLSFVDKASRSFVAAMKDVDAFKRQVDCLKTSYGVAVKGRTFPKVPKQEPTSKNVTVLEASSWAMANCFQIEKTLGRVRAAWYVDGRIARKLTGVGPSRVRKVELLPSRQPRTVHLYTAYLWDGAD